MRDKVSLLLIALLFSGALISSCKKDDPAVPGNPSFKGDFVSSAHTTDGVASIDQDETMLTLTDFKTDSGPDLNIYLASDISNVTADFIDLGNIKGVDGDYSYNLPDNTDFLTYKFVVVWCVAFNVNFGYAELQKQ